MFTGERRNRYAIILSEDFGISALENEVFGRQSTHFVQRMSEIRYLHKRLFGVFEKHWSRIVGVQQVPNLF